VSAGDLALRHVLDLEQLRALGQRYARAVDGRDHAALAGLFTTDATIDGLRGSAPIAEYLETVRSTPPAFETSMHVLGDPLITLEPGTDSAALDTYAVVYQIASLAPGGTGMTLGIRYHDAATRVGDAWRIRHRRTELLWTAPA
jgi:hypothetical protein